MKYLLTKNVFDGSGVKYGENGDENGPTWKRMKYGEMGTRMVRHGKRDEVWRTGDENGPTWKRVKYGELGTRMVRHGSG